MKSRKLPIRGCLLDLHLHLDGAVSVSSARQLAEIAGISVPESDEELERMLRVPEDCCSLNEFLERFEFPCSLLQTAEGLRLATENLLRELTAQGIMYAELRFAPQKSTDCGLTQEDAVRAVLEGMKTSPIPVRLILCCMRGGNPGDNLETVSVAAKYRKNGVCAVDLAGAEALFPTSDYRMLMEVAGSLGLPITIHAGEAAGPDSVRAALAMGACRIGHGVRACSDPDLVRELAEKQIPLEMCPTSNRKTCAIADMAEFPLRAFLAAGVCVTVNTDDPSIEGTTEAEELTLVWNEFHLTTEELRQLLQNAVTASFASEDEKIRMRERIEEEFASL